MNPPPSALDRAIAHPEPVAGVGPTSPMSGLERRSLGFGDVLAQSVSAMAPCAAAATIPAILAVRSGGDGLLAAVLGVVLILLTAATINQFTQRMATAGSLYTFTAKGLGATAGFVSGSALVLGYGFIAMYALVCVGAQVSNLLSYFGFAPDPTVVSLVCVLVCAAGCAVVMVRGVRLSARVSLLIESVAVALLVVLIVALFLRQGGVSVAALVPRQVSAGQLVAGVVIAMTAFVGFESAASLSVETRKPFATVPRVLTWSPIAAGVLVVAATAVQTTGFEAANVALDGAPAPVSTLANFYGVAWITPLLDLGVAASFVACALASTTALVRVLLALGIDGVLPAAVGRTHPRFKTPHIALYATMPVITAVPVVLLLAGVTSTQTFGILLAVSAGGYVLAYALVCVSAVAFLRRIGELTLRPALTAVGTALLLGGCLLVFLVTEARSPRAWGVWLLLGCLALSLAWFVRARLRMDPTSIGTHDIPIHDEVLGGVPVEPTRRP
ncbi:APC family permease [Nocardia sp. NPDC058176]|uniref:APC family permease n=1 Tax=Nocardia sp. NPDC058176 TaxID=3346368 RepID=UPI0036DC6B7F